MSALALIGEHPTLRQGPESLRAFELMNWVHGLTPGKFAGPYTDHTIRSAEYAVRLWRERGPAASGVQWLGHTLDTCVATHLLHDTLEHPWPERSPGTPNDVPYPDLAGVFELLKKGFSKCVFDSVLAYSYIDELDDPPGTDLVSRIKTQAVKGRQNLLVAEFKPVDLRVNVNELTTAFQLAIEEFGQAPRDLVLQAERSLWKWMLLGAEMGQIVPYGYPSWADIPTILLENVPLVDQYINGGVSLYTPPAAVSARQTGRSV